MVEQRGSKGPQDFCTGFVQSRKETAAQDKSLAGMTPQIGYTKSRLYPPRQVGVKLVSRKPIYIGHLASKDPLKRVLLKASNVM